MRALLVLCLSLCATFALAADMYVARAMFTSAVVEREPVDVLTDVESQIGRLSFFSELRGFEGKKVSHRWFYRDRLMAEISFHPKGPRWRVHSYKTLLAHWLGKWRVDIVVDDELLIESHSFILVESDFDDTVMLINEDSLVADFKGVESKNDDLNSVAVEAP